MGILVLLGLLFLVVPLIVIGAFGLKGGYASAETCRACKYALAGLRSDRCPECGSRLAGSGTRRKGSYAWEWDPPKILGWPMRLVLVALISIPAYAFLNVLLPHTIRNKAVFQIDDPGRRWTAHFTATGTRDLWTWGQGDPSLGRSLVLRPNVTMRIQSGTGDSVSLRVVDLIRRAEYRNSKGERIHTLDAVTVADIREAAAGIKDPRTRSSVENAAPELLSWLQACTTGTPSLGSGPTFDEYSHPTLVVAIPVAMFYSTVLGHGLWRTRPSRRLHLALHRPQKPNQGVEPFE